MNDGLSQLKLPLLLPSIVFLELSLDLPPKGDSHFLLPQSFALQEDLVIELLPDNRDKLSSQLSLDSCSFISNSDGSSFSYGIIDFALGFLDHYFKHEPLFLKLFPLLLELTP